jgi:hypothetical protein
MLSEVSTRFNGLMGSAAAGMVAALIGAVSGAMYFAFPSQPLCELGVGRGVYLNEDLPAQHIRARQHLDILRLDILHQMVAPGFFHDLHHFYLLASTGMAFEGDYNWALTGASIPLLLCGPKCILQNRLAHILEPDLLGKSVPVKHLRLSIVAVPHIDLNTATPPHENVLVPLGGGLPVQLVAGEICVVGAADEVARQWV